jgi:hypothetical protein
MQEPRVRKRDPHRCPKCSAAFDVTYFDDRVGERSLLPMTIAKAACPSCGHSRTVSMPAGSDRTLVIELSVGPEADEGGGG